VTKRLCIYGSRGCLPSVEEITETLWSSPFGSHFGEVVPGRPDAILVCGMARGADEAGYRWATTLGVTIEQYPANWDRHGKVAGHVRNQAMAAVCHAAIGFWDGSSTGTANMTAHLVSLGKPVRLVKWSNK